MDFKEEFASFMERQQTLDEEKKQLYANAVKHVQEVIDTIGIKQSDLRFEPMEERRTRTPARIKYRTPTGIEWTGKGVIKKELKEWLDQNNMTLEDIKLY